MPTTQDTTLLDLQLQAPRKDLSSGAKDGVRRVAQGASRVRRPLLVQAFYTKTINSNQEPLYAIHIQTLLSI